MARRAVLGVDIGTSSVRSALFNARGIRIAGTLAQRQYPLITDHDGRAELSPNGVLRALRACLDDTHASVESAKGKWSIEAVDWSTGKSIGYWIMGGSQFNTLGAGIIIDDDGRITCGSIFGKTRLVVC